MRKMSDMFNPIACSKYCLGFMLKQFLGEQMGGEGRTNSSKSLEEQQMAQTIREWIIMSIQSEDVESTMCGDNIL